MHDAGWRFAIRLQFSVQIPKVISYFQFARVFPQMELKCLPLSCTLTWLAEVFGFLITEERRSFQI